MTSPNVSDDVTWGCPVYALFAPIANAAVFKATVETAEYWTKQVCDESIEEIMSDGAIKAAWAACVKNHASTYEQEKLGWNGGWFPPTSEDIFPYNQRAGDGSKRIRAREADDVIRRATGVSGMKFVGKSDAPSKVMNADQIENMLKRCGVANQREHIEYIQAYAAEKMDYEDWEIEWQ